jgi:murein DD-endopeptidase MepM/ murein hydrolase activator NlpD
MIHPLLGRTARSAYELLIRTGGATGRVGFYGLTRTNRDGSPKMHKGLDLLCVERQPIYAAHVGRIDRAGWENPRDQSQGYGQRLWLVDGDCRTCYAHLDTILVSKPGTHVEAGQLIALAGRTGNLGTGIPTHLHFEVHGLTGPVDPLPLLRAGLE